MEKITEDGELVIRVCAMPGDTNFNGDIFGGWVLSQMDFAGVSMAAKTSHSRVTTAAVTEMSFESPVHVGDFLCCYAKLLKVGRTSMTIKVTTYAVPYERTSLRRLVTHGTFVYVAIDADGKPIPVEK